MAAKRPPSPSCALPNRKAKMSWLGVYWRKILSKTLETLAFKCCNYSRILLGVGSNINFFGLPQRHSGKWIISGIGTESEREDRRLTVSLTHQLTGRFAQCHSLLPEEVSVNEANRNQKFQASVHLWDRDCNQEWCNYSWVSGCSCAWVCMHLESQKAKAWLCWTSVKLQISFSDMILLHE